MFSWEDIPGNDSKGLMELKQKLNIDWIDTAKIEKTDNDNAIKISTEKSSLSLKLNDEKTEVNLRIDDDVRIYNFIVKMENGKLNIYSITNLSRATLTDIDFKLIGATLSHTNFSEATLHGADFSGICLTGANFSGADLSEANLSEAKLSGAYLAGANLSGANLSTAKSYLKNYSKSGSIEGTDLSEADLSNANLSEANLNGVNLSGANLSNANLIGAKTKKITVSESTKAGTIIFETLNAIDKDLRNKILRDNPNLKSVQETSLQETLDRSRKSNRFTRRIEKEYRYLEANRYAAKMLESVKSPETGTIFNIPISKQDIPYTISGTDFVCSDGELSPSKNPAMQQMWDDIRRTCIARFDFREEVTPEVINYFLEVLNHQIRSAAIVQEHMVETHPALVDDCYVRVFAGDEKLQDEIDKQFIINIDQKFPDYQAKQIKEAVGNTVWQVVHIPTPLDVQNACRWMQKQVSIVSGGSAIKHSDHIELGSIIPARRLNEAGDLCFCHMADIVQTSRTPDDPCYVVVQVASAASVLYQTRHGGYMENGIEFPKYATPVLTNDIFDELIYWGEELVKKKYGRLGTAKAIETVKDISTIVTGYGHESNKNYFENYESFDSSQIAMTIAIAAGCSTAMATGSSNAGLSALYLSMDIQKNAGNPYGTTNVFLTASGRSCICEPGGPDYENYAESIGHLGGYAAITAAAYAGKKNAFCLDPIIKTAFADDILKFDFVNPRKAFGKGALGD